MLRCSDSGRDLGGVDLRETPASLQVIIKALGDWWHDWVNQLVLNLVWALAWLTIVLGPPATLGMYYVNNHLVHGESLGIAGLLEGSRRYFLASWLWMSVNLLVVILVVVNYFYYASFSASWSKFLQAFFLLLGLFWLLVQFYALPYLMEQEQKRLLVAMRNGLFTALAAPGFTLVLGGAVLVVALLSLVTVAPLFLGGPCLIATIGNHAVIERIATFKLRDRRV